MKNFNPYSGKFTPKGAHNSAKNHHSSGASNSASQSNSHSQTPPNTPQGPSNSKPPMDPTSTPQTQPAPSTSPTEDSAAKITALTSDLQRTRADFENFRKQADARRVHAEKTARLQTVSKFLPLLDNLGHAFGAYPELAPLQKTFDKTLSELGLTPIEITADTEFNPDLHEAVTAEGEGDRELVAEILRPGYYYDGEILRPAMVKVRRA